jgi:hypothetical protein
MRFEALHARFEALVLSVATLEMAFANAILPEKCTSFEFAEMMIQKWAERAEQLRATERSKEP